MTDNRPRDLHAATTVTRAEIEDAVRRAGWSARQARGLVRHTLKAITDALSDRQTVTLRGFGRFEVNERAARSVRDFRRGISVPSAPGHRVAFRASRNLRDRMTRALLPCDEEEEP